MWNFNAFKKTGSLITAVLLLAVISSVYFYKERVLFIDDAHILFRIINEQKFDIVVGRYGSFITQIFPLAASFLHLPLKLVMIAYSASFYIFYGTVTLLLIYKYKRHDLAIIFILYLSLFVSDTYFWTNNEVHQGIAWLLLSFAITFYSAYNKRNIILLTALFVISFTLSIWTHPLVMFVAIYLWFFYWFDGRYWPFSRKQSIFFTILLVAIAYAKYVISKTNWYDGGRIDIINAISYAKIKTIFCSPQWIFFSKNCLYNYWIFVLLFFACLLSLIKERKYLLALLTMLSASGLYTLICITYWDLNTNRFYIESEYMPLTIICTAPFVYYSLSKMKPNVIACLLLIILSIRVGYIAASAPKFINRVALINHIINRLSEKKITKVIINDTDRSLDEKLIMNWGAPAESILLSKIKGNVPQATFVFINQNDMKAYTDIGKDTLIDCFKKRGIGSLNASYFTIDTNSKYVILSYREIME